MRRRNVALCAVATIALAGCTGGGHVRTTGATRPAATPTATATYGVVRSGRVLVGPLSLAVPSGWHVTADSDFSHSCLAPGTAPEQLGCAGLDAYYDWGNGFLPGNEASDFRQSPGWYHGTGVAPCPVDPTNGPHGLNAIKGGELVKRTLAPVGDRKAEYYEWSASCDNGYAWHPRAWYLPISRVLVFDYAGRSRTDELMRHATFDGRWMMAYLHAMNGAAGARTVDVDPFTWLSGAAANRYAKAHHMESPVPNDYLIVDDDESTVTTPISEQATVISEFALAGTEPGHPKPVSLEQLAGFLAIPDHWGTPFHLHLNAAGAIDQVVEQYVP